MERSLAVINHSFLQYQLKSFVVELDKSKSAKLKSTMPVLTVKMFEKCF